MAFSRTLAASGATTGIGSTLALPAYNQVAGRTIVLLTSTWPGSGQISSITDTAGNNANYTKQYTGNGFAGAYNDQIYVCKNCLGNAANVITIHYASTASHAVAFYYDVDGADPTTPVDVIVAGSVATSVPAQTTSAFSTTNPNTIVLALAERGDNNITWSVGTLYEPITLASDALTEGAIPANFTQAVGTWASDATNGAYASVGAGFDALFENGQTYGNDQFSECVMTSTAAPYAGPAVRIAANGSTFYACVQIAGNLNILKSGAVSLASVAHAYVQGQTVRLVASGSKLLVYVNAVLTLSVTDTVVTSGRPGLVSNGTGSSTSKVMSSWVGGNAVTTTPTLDSTGVQQGSNGATVTSALLAAAVTGAFLTITESAAAGTGMVGVAIQEGALTYSVSGSAGVAGATVAYTGTSSGSVVADGSGNYTITGLINGSYTLTPSLTGYIFSPVNSAQVVNDANITGVNFTATAVYSISGSTGVTGTTISYTGTSFGSVTASTGGAYSITGLLAGSYTLTPSQVGYVFSPTSAAETVTSSNITGVNFTPTAAYSISGNVGVGGATITYSTGEVILESGPPILLETAQELLLEGGTGGTVVADGSGNYTIAGLVNSLYTLTPTLVGYMFTPASAGETVNGADITGVNFTAQQAVTVYSVPDDRNYGNFPNTAVNVQGTLTYTTPSVYSLRYWFDMLFARTQPLPVDSRAAGAPIDSRAANAGTTPQNSRTPGTFGPGE